MSELTDALEKLKIVPRGPRCSVGVLLSDLQDNDPAGYKLLSEMIDNNDIGSAQIVSALAAAKVRMGRETIVRHRRRAKGTGCRCVW